jgi:hypothetical protein
MAEQTAHHLREYETIFLVKPDLTDEGVDKLKDREIGRALCREKVYIAKYYIYGIGHYNPSGNHFCAFSLKDTVLSWLDPKPVTYRGDNTARAALLASRLA